MFLCWWYLPYIRARLILHLTLSELMGQDNHHGEIITVFVNKHFLVIIFVKTKPQVDKFLQSMCLYNFRLFRLPRKLNFCFFTKNNMYREERHFHTQCGPCGLRNRKSFRVIARKLFWDCSVHLDSTIKKSLLMFYTIWTHNQGVRIE